MTLFCCQLLTRTTGLEEERDQLIQAQSESGQLMVEFFASVSAAEDAAAALSALEELSQSLEGSLTALVPEIQMKTLAAQSQSVRAGEEQLRVIQLEMELEERGKEASDAKEELERLNAKLDQLVSEKAEFQAQVKARIAVLPISLHLLRIR
jgi:chromosome segregation ATPase